MIALHLDLHLNAIRISEELMLCICFDDATGTRVTNRLAL